MAKREALKHHRPFVLGAGTRRPACGGFKALEKKHMAGKSDTLAKLLLKA